MFSYLLPKLIYKKDIISLSDDHKPGMVNVLTYAGKKMGCLLYTSINFNINSNAFLILYVVINKPFFKL